MGDASRGRAAAKGGGPFYGPVPSDPDFSKSPNAAVLGIFAELDDQVNASHAPSQAALQQAKLTHEIVTFAGADHEFFNDTGLRCHAQAAAGAYQRMIDWFGKHLS